LMVRTLLRMTETPEPSDAADALAVALCHLQAEQVRQRFGLPDMSASTKLRAEPRALRAAVPHGGATHNMRRAS